jgi:hypothetical protein
METFGKNKNIIAISNGYGGGGGNLIVCPTLRYYANIFHRKSNIPQIDTPEMLDVVRHYCMA